MTNLSLNLLLTNANQHTTSQQFEKSTKHDNPNHNTANTNKSFTTLMRFQPQTFPNCWV